MTFNLDLVLDLGLTIKQAMLSFHGFSIQIFVSA